MQKNLFIQVMNMKNTQIYARIKKDFISEAPYTNGSQVMVLLLLLGQVAISEDMIFLTHNWG